MRNTGTGEPLATATRLVSAEIEISDGRLLTIAGPRLGGLGHAEALQRADGPD